MMMLAMRRGRRGRLTFRNIRDFLCRAIRHVPRREGLSDPSIYGARLLTSGLAQAELARSCDRRGAVLNAQFAVQGALVGFHGVQ
ncbi:hypothetical protein ACVWWN_000167 [Mycobacterium sp. URHB0021]